MNVAYKVLRTILTPIYKFYYNPKIIGKENIPKEGSIIIAGNHKHLMDQCNIIISTKRVITSWLKKNTLIIKRQVGSLKWYIVYL